MPVLGFRAVVLTCSGFGVQDGFQDDSLRLIQNVKRGSPACQVSTHSPHTPPAACVQVAVPDWRSSSSSSSLGQILLFSATFSERVKQFAARVVPSANQVLVPQEQLSLDVIQQYKVRCPDAQAKDEVLRERIMMLAEKAKATIIFVRTRENAKKLHRCRGGGVWFVVFVWGGVLLWAVLIK